MSARRPDAAAKIAGSFEFSNDLVAAGLLFGATVRSPHAHARLVSIDTAPALALDGVVTILTIADVPGARRVGHITPDQPVFADGVVRYAGEPVAFVVACDQQRAWEAATAVHVTYEPLPVVADPTRALDADAPLVHPAGNLVRRLHLRRGEIHPGAPVVVRGEWETGRQDQAFLAPESAVAHPDPDGGVTLCLATQDLHTDHTQVAAALGLDPALVRLFGSGIGGAFGGREDITLQVHLCLAALRTGRPVKTTYRRGESFLAHPQRHPARLSYEVGADHDGRLRYVKARVLLDGGAYASTSAPVVGTACYFAAGPYRVPAVDIVGESVYTHNPVAGAMRGFGAVQACFGIESTMDLLAQAVGLDPVELRRRNVVRPGDRFPTSGQAVVDAPALELLERCVALPLPLPLPEPLGSAHPYAWPGGTGATTRGEGVRRGVGVALGVKNALFAEGHREWSVATVRVSRHGVEVISAAAECGQGIASVLVHIAGEVFGEVPVHLGPVSTEAGYAGSSSASRQTWMSGNAVRMAAQCAHERLIGHAAHHYGIAPGDVHGGLLDLEMLLGDTVLEATQTYEAPPSHHGDPTTGQGDVHVTWMMVAHRAVVDVDVELGLVKVVQVSTAQDVGRALNPREVRGQIVGGISQGVGLALTEHLASSAGLVANASFTDYLIPTAADMPEIVIDLVEHPDPANPLGVRGAGEPPSLSSTAAIAAAIRDATGRPVRRVPARPDDVVFEPAPSASAAFM